jgi:hypothetical protein
MMYYAAGTWGAPRRLGMKAEWLAKGPNPRFVVTNLDLLIVSNRGRTLMEGT